MHGLTHENRQYDYEANGNNVVLISPANVTVALYDEAADNFWEALDAIEYLVLPEQEHQRRVQGLISSYF